MLVIPGKSNIVIQRYPGQTQLIYLQQLPLRLRAEQIALRLFRAAFMLYDKQGFQRKN